MGVRAVLSLLNATADSEPKVMCLRSNAIVESSLIDCVEATKKVAEAIEMKDFEKALESRGPYVYLSVIYVIFLSHSSFLL